MTDQPKIIAFVVGVGGAILINTWWHSELAWRAGANAAQSSLHCLIVGGTGDCALLWWLGLHEENEIASVLFYSALGLAIWAFVKIMSSQNPSNLINRRKR